VIVSTTKSIHFINTKATILKGKANNGEIYPAKLIMNPMIISGAMVHEIRRLVIGAMSET
jgi:hypothetical protein